MAESSGGENPRKTPKESRQWHWSCASKYCKNSWKSGESYYRLTKVASAPKAVLESYLNVLGRPKSQVNFKRHVICCKHWKSGERKDYLDKPTIKFISVKDKVQKSGKEHWNCAAALCTNSWRTTKDNLTYYRLSTISSCPEKKPKYEQILKNKGVNFKKDFICSEHWSSGYRKDIEDLPDVPCTSDYAKKNVTKKVTPNSKITAAKRVINQQQTNKAPKRRILNYGSQNDTTQILETELTELREKLKEKIAQIEKLTDEVESLNKQNVSYEQQLKFFSQNKENCSFSYANLKNKPKRFEYMTGLSLCDFDCIYECVEPYLSAMVYPDCKVHHSSQRKLSKKTELMCFFTICRHTLHLGIMAFMTATSDATQSRIFTGWSVFLATLFDEIDLSPCPGEVSSLLPSDFWASGFQDTVLLGDCTENWIASPENYDISSATFSSYKNHDTGKTGIWITPYGSLVMCTDTYPGAITDNDLTADCGVLDMIKEKGSTVLTDKGFGIEDLCLSKGLLHNRPPLKFDAQYDESEVSKNSSFHQLIKCRCTL